jgi:hypothetical protein
VSIVQSKLQYLDELRALVGADGNEQLSRPRERDFGAYVSRCLPQHRFEFTTTFATKLLDKSGVREWCDLPRMVAQLSRASRDAMLDAMLKGDGTFYHGHSWVFGQKAKPGVMEAFEILATLKGYALGKPRVSSIGDVPVRRVRSNRLVNTNYLRVEVEGQWPAWCPATRLGTWIMNMDGCISITGGAKR